MTAKPHRIQRKRIRGWRMPEDAVYVGRPTKWGNPHRFGGRDLCVRRYKATLSTNPWTFPTREDICTELRGKNLCCWCPLDKPCHADVLLEIANS